jgi:predicted nucleic acid-binding protein
MWYSPEALRAQSIALLEVCGQQGIRMIAPDCLFAEAGSAIRRQVYRGLLTKEEGKIAITLISGIQLDCVPVRDLYKQSWEIAGKYNLATLYDAYYLALAELRGCDFWTADERFINSVQGIPYVKHIADFSPDALEI